MDRLPKPAPFKVGARVRYVGTHESYTFDIDPITRERKTVPLLVPGLEVVIAEARPGRQGTLRQLSDSDGPLYYEDTEGPILDDTRDGYNVYYVDAYQNGTKQGRCIHGDCKKDWELVK